MVIEGGLLPTCWTSFNDDAIGIMMVPGKSLTRGTREVQYECRVDMESIQMWRKGTPDSMYVPR
jgi:hypothetical protein